MLVNAIRGVSRRPRPTRSRERRSRRHRDPRGRGGRHHAPRSLHLAGRKMLDELLTAAAPNHLDDGGPRLLEAILAAVGDLAGKALGARQPRVVVVAYPGPIDDHGNVLAMPTLLGRADGKFDLGAACRRLWPDAVVHTMNDVTAAGYRYVATGLQDFAIVTVGSGIGHKLFLDGRPRVGPRGRGGEIGHLRLDRAPDAVECECGGRGHLGGLASGRAVVADCADDRRRNRASPAPSCATRTPSRGRRSLPPSRPATPSRWRRSRWQPASWGRRWPLCTSIAAWSASSSSVGLPSPSANRSTPGGRRVRRRVLGRRPGLGSDPPDRRCGRRSARCRTVRRGHRRRRRWLTPRDAWMLGADGARWTLGASAGQAG